MNFAVITAKMEYNKLCISAYAKEGLINQHTCQKVLNVIIDIINSINIEVKYEGYLKQQEDDIKKLEKEESLLIADDIDFFSLKGLRLEARQKLDKIKPKTISQASRISGVSPADISVLIIYLKMRQNGKN